MKKQLYYKFLLCLSMLIPLGVRAQSDDGGGGMQLIAKAALDSVVLRWAPTSPAAWDMLNRYGYRLERFTILRDGQRLNIPEQLVLNPQPLKPKPLPAWEALVMGNDYAAIAAQAIYGESFEVSGNYESDMIRVLQAAKELEQRFSFALFAADMSPAVARLSGLGFTDTQVRRNEKYLYRVISAAPAGLLAADTGLVYLSPVDTLSLPRPVRLKVEFEDRVAMLSWNKQFYEHIYMAYQVERSTDGRNFSPVTKLPVTNTDAPSGYKPELMFKLDSLPANGVTCHYRVRGYTPFGELGPPSEAVSGKGFVPLKATPAIVTAVATNTQRIQLSWNFPKADEGLLKGYTILRATNAKGPYRTVASDLSPALRDFEDPAPDVVNYYKVLAISKEGKEAASFPYLMQLQDSIPPSAPLNLSGIIDSTGSVYLQWAPSPEADVAGYRVYRSNFATKEFVQLTVDPVTTPQFTDQLELKLLTKQVFYKVVAIDHFYNPSEFSQALKLKRLDVVPPVAPAFQQVNNSEAGIALTWAASPSEDVIRHMLYRKGEQEQGWQLIALFDDTTRTYVDKSAAKEIYYDYTLLAKDDSGLESKPSQPVRGRVLDKKVKEGLKHILAEADHQQGAIRLRWEKPAEEVLKFAIYRSQGSDPLTLYRTITGQERAFLDSAVGMSKVYTYRLKVYYQDGSESPYSREVKITY